MNRIENWDIPASYVSLPESHPKLGIALVLGVIFWIQMSILEKNSPLEHLPYRGGGK